MLKKSRNKNIIEKVLFKMLLPQFHIICRLNILFLFLKYLTLVNQEKIK